MSLIPRVFGLRPAGALLACAIFVAPAISHARDLRVPNQYGTIQAAIDAASPGDRVLISKGTYFGRGNTDLDCYGKAITIEGSGSLSTIIDCKKSSHGFLFHNAETASTEIRSLCVQNAQTDGGGAMVIDGASPSIIHCDFADNASDYGAAIQIIAGSPGIINCTFERNHATEGGAGIFSSNASPTISACTFTQNDSLNVGGAIAMQNGSLFVVSCVFNENIGDNGGGAFYASGGDVAFVNGSFSVNSANVNGGAIDLNDQATASLTNCTVAANLSHNGPGGMRVGDKSNATVSNCIFWTDGSKEITGQANIRFTCITGGATGDGNTADDPKLVDAIDHDLHIRVGSACIDKGDTSSVVINEDQDGRARTIGTSTDMGAYEYPIVRPVPIVAATGDTFTVPHDGNPNTDTANVTVHGSGFDWLNGALTYQWTLDGKVLGTAPDLTLQMEPGDKQFLFTARDPSGGVSNQKVNVKVLPEPNSPPTANAGPDINLTSTGGAVHVVLHGHGFDPDGDPLDYQWDDPYSQTTADCTLDLGPGNYYYTLTVTDPYGAKGQATVRVHIADGKGPEVKIIGDNPMKLEVFDTWVDPGATATDDVDGSNLVVKVYGTVNNQKLGDYSLTYAATDSSGNTGTAARLVQVRDTQAPVITLKGDNPMTVDCSKGYTEPGATAIDNYDGSVPVTISGTVTSGVGTYTITYTATDSSGNQATATRTVIVQDPNGPVIVLNGANPMHVECGNGYVEPGATATDGCLGATLPVTITGSVPSSNGTYTVTYSATDASGTTATATRTVIVSDNTAPVITLNGDNPMTVECGTGYVEPGATATDACDGNNIPVSISGTVSAAKGTYTVTYTAVDKTGNKATVTRTVKVQDTKAPVITLNGTTPMTVECGTGYVEPGATATDGCDGNNVPVTISGNVLTAKGTYTVTYTATDSSGNTATATRTVKVTDTKPPVITLTGSSTMTVECGTGYTEFGALAMDACDGAVAVTITGTVPTAKGTYTVTYKASDSSGNTATATRTVNVTDTTPPVITLNGSTPMSVQCGTGYTEPGATAVDSCDGTLSVTITGSVLTSKGTYTVTYKATDSSGNSATATRTVNVVDTTAPVIKLNGSNPMTVECGSGYSEPGATATDSCDGAVAVTISGAVLTSKGTYTVTYTATDSSGNKATATRTVNVSDTTAPVLTLKGSNPMTVECGNGFTDPGATATDTCDGTVTVTTTGTVVPTVKGTYTITYKATDSAGNFSTLTRTVTVVDTTAPVITLNGSNPMTVDCQKGYTEPGATAVDACDGSVTVTITGSVPSTAGTYTVTYTATDSSGNKATATRTVNVVAKTPPSANNFNATPTSIKGGKTTNVNLHYGFDQHCAAYSWDVECTASPSAGSVITKIDNNNFTIKAVTGTTYTFTLTVTDIDGNTSVYTITVMGT